MFSVGAEIKHLFFDRQSVKNLIAEKERKGLERIGKFLRTRSRSSMRRRKSPSRVGQTPTVWSHSEHATLRNILYAYEPSRHGVVIGPVKLASATRNLTANTVPELLEKGGTVGIREKLIHGRWVTASTRRRRAKVMATRVRRAVYGPRPFMGPALQKELEQKTLPKVFVARAA